MALIQLARATSSSRIGSPEAFELTCNISQELTARQLRRHADLGRLVCANATFDMRPSLCTQARILLSFPVSVIF